MQNIPKEQSRRITGKKGKVEAMSASSAFINNGYLIIEKTQKLIHMMLFPQVDLRWIAFYMSIAHQQFFAVCFLEAAKISCNKITNLLHEYIKR